MSSSGGIQPVVPNPFARPELFLACEGEHGPLQVVGTSHKEGAVQYALGDALTADFLDTYIRLTERWQKRADQYKRDLARAEKENRKLMKELKRLTHAYEQSHRELLDTVLESGYGQDIDPPGDFEDYPFSEN